MMDQDAATREREMRLYNISRYLLMTPIHEIDFEQTGAALAAIAEEQARCATCSTETATS